MIKNKCCYCGGRTTFFRAVLASKSFPFVCETCGKSLFRPHYIVRALTIFGSGAGLFLFFILFMAKGAGISIILFYIYLLFLIVMFALELCVFDLSEFDEREENIARTKSKKNIWVALTVVAIGTLLFLFED